MKKVTVLSFAIFLFGTVAVNAQTQVTTTTTTEVVAKAAEKTPIKKEELPEGIVKTLASDDYKGWDFVNANLVKENA